jgi:hypothetical protein
MCMIGNVYSWFFLWRVEPAMPGSYRALRCRVLLNMLGAVLTRFEWLAPPVKRRLRIARRPVGAYSNCFLSQVKV